MRILVVEDDKKVAGFIQKGLQQESHAVDVAYDGQTGAYQAENFDYDLIVLDLMLPHLSGMEVLRRTRARNPQLPVLILTAKSDIKDRVAAWMAAQMTIWSNPSRTRSFQPECACCCAVLPRRKLNSESPTWKWTTVRASLEEPGKE